MKTSRTSIYLHSVLYSFSSFFSFNKANSLLLGLVDFVDSIRSTISSCTILTRRKATPYQNATRHEPTVQVWLALLRYPRDVTTLQVINSLTRTLSLSHPLDNFSCSLQHPTECLSTLQSVASYPSSTVFRLQYLRNFLSPLWKTVITRWKIDDDGCHAEHCPSQSFFLRGYCFPFPRDLFFFKLRKEEERRRIRSFEGEFTAEVVDFPEF